MYIVTAYCTTCIRTCIDGSQLSTPSFGPPPDQQSSHNLTSQGLHPRLPPTSTAPGATQTSTSSAFMGPAQFQGLRQSGPPPHPGSMQAGPHPPDPGSMQTAPPPHPGSMQAGHPPPHPGSMQAGPPPPHPGSMQAGPPPPHPGSRQAGHPPPHPGSIQAGPPPPHPGSVQTGPPVSAGQPSSGQMPGRTLSGQFAGVLSGYMSVVCMCVHVQPSFDIERRFAQL